MAVQRPFSSRCCSFWPQERQGWTGCFSLMSQSKQPAAPSHGGCFLNSNRGMSGRIQTRCAIKHAEGLMNTIGPPHWWIFSAATETRDGYLFKRAPTKGLCGGLTSALQPWRPSNTSMSAFLSCVKSLISKERHLDFVMEIIRFPFYA